MVRLQMLSAAAVAALLVGCTTGFEVTQDRFEQDVRNAFDDLEKNLQLAEGERLDNVGIAGTIYTGSLETLDDVARGPCEDFFNDSRRLDLLRILKDCIQKNKALSLGPTDMIEPTSKKMGLQYPEDLYTPTGQEQLAQEFRRVGEIVSRLLLAKVNITRSKDPGDPSGGENGLMYTVQLDMYDIEEVQHLAVGMNNPPPWVSLPRRTIFGQVWDLIAGLFGKVKVNGQPLAS